MLSSYNPANRIGGLLTFPSLHLWSKASDVFSYVSDGSTPIVLILYEQMSYMIYRGIGHQKLIELMENYSVVHTTSSKSPNEYFSKILPFLYESNMIDWEKFKNLSYEIIKERVNHTIERIEEYLIQTKENIKFEIESIAIENLKNSLIESQFNQICGQLEKQLHNIRGFRPH